MSTEELEKLREITPEVINDYLGRYSGLKPIDATGGTKIKSRHIHHPDNVVATEALARELKRIGGDTFSVKMHQFHEGRVLYNVEAELRGNESDEIVLITAHLDSTAAKSEPYSGENDPAPGADDDASGVAAVLAIADVIKKLSEVKPTKRSIRFVLFNAEEQGLVGSKAYARDQAAFAAPIVAVYQMDMIGYNKKLPRSFEVHAGCWANLEAQNRSIALAERIQKLTNKVSPGLESPQIYMSNGPTLETGKDPADERSDHTSFQKEGYAAIVVSEDLFPGPSGSPEPEGNPDYHMKSDTFVDFNYAADIARVVAAAAWTTANYGEIAMATEILAWDDDPASETQPINRPIPDLSIPPLAISINGTAPTPQSYPIDTKEFRYWTAAEALRRAAEFWSSLLPTGTTWYITVGSTLPVSLDKGFDLNAYYDRRELAFFHYTNSGFGGKTVFSGESPDVLCHELGHAVLDTLRPQLWGVFSGEAAALHESFGDISSILCALQLPSIRREVLPGPGERLYRSSRLSRLGEQIGWGIRQLEPDQAEPDCLRNAVNSFFYQKPETLPSRGPASTLSSEPHSFSRVFTGGWFEALSNMLLTQSPSPTENDLLAISKDAGRLLVDAILAAPIVPDYFSQVAAHMIEADGIRFAGKYSDALKSAFIKHGILSLRAASEVTRLQRSMVSSPITQPTEEPLPQVALSGRDFGLDVDAILVNAPTEPKRFQITSAFTAAGVTPSSPSNAAQAFVEDLFQQGNIEIRRSGIVSFAMIAPPAQSSERKTHVLVEEDGKLVLKRQLFDCGFKCCCKKCYSL